MEFNILRVLSLTVLIACIHVAVAPDYNNNNNNVVYKDTDGSYRNGNNNDLEGTLSPILARIIFKRNRKFGRKTYGSSSVPSVARNTGHQNQGHGEWNGHAPVVRNTNYLPNAELNWPKEEEKEKPSLFKLYKIRLYTEGIDNVIVNKFEICQNATASIAENLGVSMSRPVTFVIEQTCCFAFNRLLRPITVPIGRALFGKDFDLS